MLTVRSQLRLFMAFYNRRSWSSRIYIIVHTRRTFPLDYKLTACLFIIVSYVRLKDGGCSCFIRDLIKISQPVFNLIALIGRRNWASRRRVIFSANEERVLRPCRTHTRSHTQGHTHTHIHTQARAVRREKHARARNSRDTNPSRDQSREREILEGKKGF